MKEWRQEEKGTIEGDMVGWHHRLDVHAFEQALGVGEGKGGLLCCSPWGCKESDMTESVHDWIITDYEYPWSFNQILEYHKFAFLIEVDVQYCVSYRCMI